MHSHLILFFLLLGPYQLVKALLQERRKVNRKRRSIELSTSYMLKTDMLLPHSTMPGMIL
jgi:hypothetical protein